MGDQYKVIGKMAATPAPPATILLVTAGATKRCWLTELHIGTLNGAALAGTTISVGRPTTAGTGGAAYTPLPDDTAAPPAIFTALSSSSVFSAEPTQPATYIWQIGLDAVASYIWIPPKPIIIPLNGRLAVRVEADNSTVKVQWVATCTIEE